MSEKKEWAIAEFYSPMKINKNWDFDDCKNYFQQYEGVNPIHVIDMESYRRLEKAYEVLRGYIIEIDSQNDQRCWYNVESLCKEALQKAEEIYGQDKET